MYKNVDYDTKKYMILLVIICIIFTIAVVKAFDYLPQKDDMPKEQIVSEQINTSSEKDKINEEEQADNEEQADKEENENLNKKTSKKIEIVKDKDDVDFVEVESPESAGKVPEKNTNSLTAKIIQELSSEEKAFKTIYKAHKARIAGDYKEAVEEYQKISLLTDDKELVALSYEGLSQVYAANKRYGTALTFALKSYNTSPNSAREMLIARIYYKTGDIDKATKLINNILKREFMSER